MYVARILYPIEVLGPGKRIGIWFCGCPRRCKGCSNPELWDVQPRFQTTPEVVFRLIKSIARDYPVDGFTLTGGDPMMQSGALKALIPLLRSISTDILVYTGYQKEDLTDEQLDGISVLIDGPYLEHRNNRCPLRGSDNQTIYILDPSLQDRYASYCAENHHQIQNFMTADGIISVGIHRPNFTEELNQIVWKKGLRTHE